MKRLTASAFALLATGMFSAHAATKLYVDEAGRVWTKPAPDRKELTNPTPWYAKASKLKFNALTYIGYTFDDFKKDTATVDYKDDTSRFEIRRAYFQVKAYLLENPKSYYRITFDVHQDSKVDDGGTDGDMIVRVKYAYLYLNEIAPKTGIEVGIAHRPWHDYEEHNAWYFRNISKVLVEDANGARLSNSADFGMLTKTDTKYFDMDLGFFNGEGYHAIQLNRGMSFEWRLTGHLLGVDGKDKQAKRTYWDVSFYGQYNQDHKSVDVDGDGNTDRFDDLVFAGLHTVYNRPEFLVAAQYLQSKDTATKSGYVSAQAGKGYSANAEIRLGTKHNYRLLARYDSWTPKALRSDDEKEQKTYIAGVAWDQYKNVEWVANVNVTDNQSGSAREKYNGIAYMLTTQIKF